MRIKELKPGHCSAYMSDWFMMRNPFKSIHAVALMNLGEAVGGFAVLTWAERSQYRAIVTKLEIEFLKKARGTIRGQCDLNEKLLPKAGQSGDIVLTTVLRDNADDIVAKITSHWKLSPEKKRI